MGLNFKKALKKVALHPINTIKASLSKDVLLSPGRAAMLFASHGLSESTGLGKKYSQQSWARYSDMAIAAIAAAIATAGLMSGPAAGAAGAAEAAGTGAGAAGAGAGAGATTAGASTGALAGSTAGAAASSGMSTGTMLTAGSLALGAGSTAYQTIESKRAQKEQSKAQAQAVAESEAAARESEIMRKQALLASQKSMTARRATAGAIANKLKNTTVSLGGDEEKLGE